MKNNDVIIIKLDRERELRFGHKALKTLEAMTGGKGIDELLNVEDMDLENLEKIMLCGLLSDARANNESLHLDDMEDLLDQAPSYKHIIDKIVEAVNAAFGTSSAPAESGNGTEQPKKARSTGSNR